MDTLEYRTEIFDNEKGKKDAASSPPIIWRGKTAREIYQERFFDQDYTFKKVEGPMPKSTRGDADYCQQYSVTPNSEQIKTSNAVYATLVEIPERK